MPSRYIREGMLTSDALKRAGEPAEVLFWRLLLAADDYGRFDARPGVIWRRCWPLGGPPDEAQVAERLETLARTVRADGSALVQLYQVDGMPYLEIPRFGQRTRALKSKFPAPDGKKSADANAKNEPARTWKTPNAGQVPDKGQADAGQVTGGRPADVRRPQAGFDVRSSVFDNGTGHVSDSSLTDDGQMPDKRTLKPPAAMSPAEREAQGIAPMPPGLAPKRKPAPPAPNGKPPDNWDETAEGIESAGQHYGMQRQKLEADPDYAARIHARIQLG